MTELAFFFVALGLVPVVVVVVSLVSGDSDFVRRIATGAAVVELALALLPLRRPELVGELLWPIDVGPLLGTVALRVDLFSQHLLPMCAALWLVSVAVTPRLVLDRAGLRRTATATLVTMGSFATESPLLLALLWTIGVVVYAFALRRPEHALARRVVPWYLGGSAVCFVVGVAFLAAADSLEPRLELAGVCFVLLAALIRKGIFPFHAWVPHVFEHGPLGPAILFAAPQLGAYAVVVLILPRVGVDVAWGVAIAALVTAVYAAALAVVQRDARRTCGYLFISQSALVMAGLDCTSERALSGALIVWIASALAFAGISRCVLVLELRRGRQDLSRYHGGYESMPALAVAFLVLGLACTGFPGTLGFIGQEMLVDGATDEFPVLGFCVIAAGSLTGVAVLRMYFSLFCGRKTSPSKLAPTRPVEVVVFGTLAAVLIATGLFPGAVADSRIEAAREIALRPHVAGLFAEEVNEHANDDTAHSRLSARER